MVLRTIRIAFLVAIFAGALGAISLAWIPVSTAGSHFVIDDMGYYLTAARNVTAGRGVTLDGVNRTNGFHPLWLLLLCGVEWLFGSDDQLVFHVALTLAVAFFLGTGVLLCRQVREEGASWLVVPFAAVFFFNYRLLSIPLGGLESGVAGMLVVAVAAAVSRWADVLDLHRATILGCLLGLACLARMDALLLEAIVLAWLTYRAWRARSWHQLGVVAACGGVAMLCLVPWFVFSWRAVHHWLPRSGEAILTWAPSPWHFPWTMERVSRAARITIIGPAGNVANLMGVWPLVNTAGIARASGAAALIATLGVLGGMAWRVRDDARVQRLVWIPGFGACLWAYYLQFAGDQHIRYLYPAVLLLFYFAAVVLGAVVRRSRRDLVWIRATHGCVAVMLIFIAAAGIDAYRQGVATGYGHRLHAPQYEGLAPWLAVHTEPSAIVGAFNGGIVVFFSRRTMVNLDGVMNDNAINAIQTHRLCDYIDDQHITYLADNELSIQFFLDADRSCGTGTWRARWVVVHRVTWPPGGGSNALDWIVMERLPPSP